MGLLTIITTKGELRFIRMVAAVGELRTEEAAFTNLAGERDKSSPDLPVDLAPGHASCFQADEEFLEIEAAICHMLCDDGAVEVDEDLGFLANHPISLLVGIELGAVDT